MSLKELKSKISGVKNTRKITEAMKMVAASKMRRNQQAYYSAKPYADHMSAMTRNVISGNDATFADLPLLGKEGAGDSYLLIAIGSQKGLAGAFNVNLVKELRAQIKTLRAQGKSFKILPVGHKLETILNANFKGDVLEGFGISEKWDDQYALAAKLGARVADEIENGDFDRCVLISNRFVNALLQNPTAFSLVPPQASESDVSEIDANFEFEPGEKDLLNRLLPRNIETQIFLGLLESAMGEQAARTSAMDGASRNAGKMIDSLTLRYNRTRQAKITQELSELVAGATAVGA